MKSLLHAIGAVLIARLVMLQRLLLAARASVRETALDLLRGWPLLLFFAITFGITAQMQPAKVGLTLYGLSRIAAGAYMGYWVDRGLFPYARPHTLEGIAEGTAWKRRALIVSACIIAAALIP